MKNEQAIQIIEAAINQGMIKGVYNLKDAVQIIQALQVLYNMNDFTQFQSDSTENQILEK